MDAPASLFDFPEQHDRSIRLVAIRALTRLQGRDPAGLEYAGQVQVRAMPPVERETGFEPATLSLEG